MESLSNVNDLVPAPLGILPVVLALILVIVAGQRSAAIVQGLLRIGTRTVVVTTMCVVVGMMVTCMFLESKTITLGGADGYTIRAENISAHGVFGVGTSPTAMFPPGYSFLLLPAIALLGISRWSVLLTNLTILIGAAVFLRHVLVRLRVPAGFANALALVVLLYPNRLLSVLVPFSDIPFSLIYTCAFALLMLGHENPGRWWYTIVGGVLAGLAALIRANGMLLVLPLLVSIWLSRGTAAGKWGRRCMLLTAGVLLVLLPWGVRNSMLFHTIIPVSSNFGVNLAIGNNPSRSTTLNPYMDTAWTSSRWDSVGGRGWNESQRDSFFAAAGWTYIREHPGRFVVAGLVKVGRTMMSDASTFGMLETYTTMRTIFFSFTRSWRLSPVVKRGLYLLSSGGYVLLYVTNNTLYYAGLMFVLSLLWKRRNALSTGEHTFVMVAVLSLSVVFVLFGLSRFKEPIPTTMLVILGLDLARGRGVLPKQEGTQPAHLPLKRA
jgi:4-amino-4-deoxy-L-arabinose transferase-like glycosyltransferase